ncbi:MAG: tannase/feruloyl esterase family alpha/beta hydrolase, partial [Rhizobacter sp.]|nr:tannase/feruloyl esterase family alpha/beta hydrolase [Rhizobacter sp.]
SGALARGFATYGVVIATPKPADARLPTPGDAALIDLAHAAHKKAHDAALWLAAQRYGRAPQRVYFTGNSEGGRAALAMAQRYPADFDGIFARAPLVQWTGLQHARWRAGIAQMDGGWLRPAQVRWWADSVRLACDKLDGLGDGIVAAQDGCGHVFRADLLRCPDGAPAGDWCLGDAQLQAVQALLGPYVFDFDLANGLRSHPGWTLGGEDAPPAGAAGGWLAWWSGLQPPTQPPNVENGLGWQHGSAAIAQWVVRDARFDLRRYDPRQFAERVRRVSALMDATDPDLAAFAARGGKLLMLEPMADQARSPQAGIDYFAALVDRLGAAVVDRFARLYLAYGVDHVGHGAPASVDMLEVMVDWVEQGSAPDVLDVVQQRLAPPHETLRARPLCRWPMFPRYRGEGDPALAVSFACASR